MELKRGTVVRSIAGHDAGRFLAVLTACEGGVLVADGKTRTIGSPKKKNPMHLRRTETVLSERELESDSVLRAALRRFGQTQTV